MKPSGAAWVLGGIVAVGVLAGTARAVKVIQAKTDPLAGLGITWKGAHPLRFARGRPHRVSAIVLHTAVMSLSEMDRFFNETPKTEDQRTSANYGIAFDGSRIHRYVKDEDTAWHAGIVDRATAPLVVARLPLNPNTYTIGIEHADNGNWNGPRDPRQITASVNLVYALCLKHGIVPSPETIIPHRQIRASKGCPGSLPVGEIIQRVQARWNSRPKA